MGLTLCILLAFGFLAFCINVLIRIILWYYKKSKTEIKKVTGVISDTIKDFYKMRKHKVVFVSLVIALGVVSAISDSSGSNLTGSKSTNVQISPSPSSFEAAITQTTENKNSIIDEDYGYVIASGHLWLGVKLYFGPKKMYVGRVIDMDENHIGLYTGRRFRGVLIEMYSGSHEWKDRDAIISGKWYVKKMTLHCHIRFYNLCL